MKLNSLTAAMVAAGLAKHVDMRPARYVTPELRPIESDKSRMTKRNPLQQREAYAAAQVKRERKQMKRLMDAQQSGEGLL